MAPQHALNHPFAKLHTHAHSIPSLDQLPTTLTSSLEALPTLTPPTLPPPTSYNPTTVASPFLTTITTSLLPSPPILSPLPASFPYLTFLTSFFLTSTAIFLSAWWIFHYPRNWSRAFAPEFVQVHQERARGFVEDREKEEEEAEDMERGSGGGCGGLERKRQGVVMGEVWGHTVWRRTAVGDVEGGRGGGPEGLRGIRKT